jgi:multiple sugar transport system ATP-binding protein
VAEVVLENVWKIFRDKTIALRDLTLEIADGEFFVFLGPSGCGKTTLLRSVAGLEAITAGRILIGGEDVTDKATKERNVAMIFQNYSLYPHMTVYDNMAFGIQSRKLKKAEIAQRVERAASMLEINALLKKRPRALSGGQQQRVAMGRAIVRDPEAFLMDEPLSNLDARFRMQMRGEIARIQRSLGVTTLFVTHDQNEAMVLGDRVGVLREGVLQQVSSPSTLYRTPDNLFVAGFVGSPPMNLAEATVEEAVDGLFLRFGGHRLRADNWTGSGHGDLHSYAWRQVVLGIRPEDLVVASEVGAGPDDRMRVSITRREVIGSDTFLFFIVDAPLLLSEDPREAAIGEEDERKWPVEHSNEWLTRIDSPAGVGDSVELAVRPGTLYLFDPRTGQVIAR